jgi:signal transduction histidine kinase
MANYVCLLKEEMIGNLTDKQKQAVGVLDRNIARMTEMVRHYLNLSRIEEGLLDPTYTQVNVLNDVLTPLIESSEQEIQRRHMMVSNTVSPGHVVYADVNMTREVFENLLSNAIKYGREGGRIAVSAAEEGAFIRFIIRNEGEGIPRERLGRLFRKFSRIEELQAASQQKGTGLGLFITRKIIEAHGGNIEADSEPGSWTEFRFTIPRYCDDNVDSGTSKKGPREGEMRKGEED